MAEHFMRVVEVDGGDGVNIIVGSFGSYFPKGSEEQARFLVENANRLHKDAVEKSGRY